MNIEILPPHSHPKGLSPIPTNPNEKPIFVVNVGTNPHIFMWADIVLTNHRTDRKERIVGCSLHLKKKHWVLWNKTISQVEVKEEGRYGETPRYRPLLDIELEPMSAPKIITAWANGPITEPIESLPHKMTLVLEFKMVGPMRRYTHKAIDLTHTKGIQDEKQRKGEEG